MPLQPAILGPNLRLGNFRLGYRPAALTARRVTKARITLAGLDAQNLTSPTRVRKAGFTIQDILNDAPNKCELTAQGTAPIGGQALRVTINSDTPRVLFSGELQTVGLSYEGKPAQRVWPCSAIDDTARANQKRPFGTWTTTSATTIAQALITTFAPAFSTAGIQAALPNVSVNFDGSEGMNGCFGQLATLVGGYFKFEDGIAYLFTTDAAELPDTIDDTPGRFLNDPPITVVSDDSQLRTRSYGKGHGEAALSDVAIGETIVPIVNAVMFNPAGGRAISLTQRLTYTGIQLGTGGSQIGPGAAPSVAPLLTLAPGAGLGTGVYQYAYTAVTGAGETLPSPIASVTTGGLPPPTTAPLNTGFTSGGGQVSGYTGYAVTYVTAAGETLQSPVRVISQITGLTCVLGSILIGPTGVTNRKVYRTATQPLTPAGETAAATAQLKLLTTIADNTTTAYTDGTADAGLGANVPTVNTATAAQVDLSGIALGPTGTTSRKIYRTVVDGSQLKLQQTIANNTATVGVTDVTADGSLGANAPVTDTSGLTTVAGQVNAGSSSLLTAGVAPFSATGGWLLLGGGQIVRYTGFTGNTLTGIPATGPGAITTTVLYGQPAVPVPALTGVTGIVVAMPKGDPVNLWVQRDDLTAQAARIALDLAQGRVSDGVIEGPIIVDERRGEVSLKARCDADLLQFAYPIVTVTYACRDPKTKSGKPVVFNVTTPSIHQTLMIQSVTIDQIDQSPGVLPRFSVTASSVRFSLDDLLRRLAQTATGREVTTNS